MQRKKEIWFIRRTTFFSPSSNTPSSTAAARTSHGATLSVFMSDICQLLFTLIHFLWKNWILQQQQKMENLQNGSVRISRELFSVTCDIVSLLLCYGKEV